MPITALPLLSTWGWLQEWSSNRKSMNAALQFMNGAGKSCFSTPTKEIQHGGNQNGSLESLKRAVQKHWWHYRRCICGQFIWHWAVMFFSQTALLRWCELMCFHWSDQIKHLQIFSHILHINTRWHCCVISSGINRSLCNREQQMSVLSSFQWLILFCVLEESEIAPPCIQTQVSW